MFTLTISGGFMLVIFGPNLNFDNAINETFSKVVILTFILPVLALFTLLGATAGVIAWSILRTTGQRTLD
jgi:hypothetical protein